jgi:carbamoyltransferase
VALNCVANGKLLREGLFDRVWIQPAGGALGAALAAHPLMLKQPRTVLPGDAMKGSYLGPAFPQAEIERRLTQAGAVFRTVGDDALFDLTSLPGPGRRAGPWAGTRAAWSSAPGHWVAVPSWPTHAPRPSRSS